MAGGIDWFRWHHGTAGDRKFPLVAKRAGARVGDVITMWAILLEQASASDDRGNPGNVDFEAIDLALDMPDGTAEAIHAAMLDRNLIDRETGRLIAWEKRQPKRERPDDNSTERSRACRHRQAEASNATQRQATPEAGDATPSNATQRQETPRGEERREEPPPSEPIGSSGGGAPQAAGDPPPPAAGAAATTRASRLPKDWKLPKGWGDWALTEFPQWDVAKVRREGEAFRDHWVAKSGKDATKLDWEATWRNWCRSSIAHRDDPRGPAPAGSGAPTQAEANAFLAAQAAIPRPDPTKAREARERFRSLQGARAVRTPDEEPEETPA